MAWQVIEKSPRISLLARKRAEELGVDITTVTGAGAEGSITAQDIESSRANQNIGSPSDCGCCSERFGP